MPTPQRSAVALIVSTLLAAAFLGGASPGASAAAGGSPGYFGISAPELLRMSSRGEAERLERHLDQIEGSGIQSVRVNVPWADWDSFVSRGLHPWRALDDFAAALAHHDLRVLPLPRGAPAWARAYDKWSCPDGDRSAIAPHAFDEYATFVGAIASRYGPGGAYWAWFDELPYRPVTRLELWNEPNWSAYWCPAPNPEAFAELVDAGAGAVRAANPQVETILGGLVSTDRYHYSWNGQIRGMPADEFLRRMVAARPSLAAKLDAVGIHLYEPTAATALTRLAWMRGAIDAAGLGAADIAITEFGWNGLDMDQSARAANYAAFVDAVGRNDDCRIDAIAAHSWATDESSPLDPEQWWGIAHPLLATPYAAASAYADQIARLLSPGASLPPSSIC